MSIESAGSPPAGLVEDQVNSYLTAPQDRPACYLQSWETANRQPPAHSVAQRNDDSTGAVLNFLPRVVIRELKYPGNTTADIDDKYIYIFRNSKIAAEIYSIIEDVPTASADRAADRGVANRRVRWQLLDSAEEFGSLWEPPHPAPVIVTDGLEDGISLPRQRDGSDGVYIAVLSTVRLVRTAVENLIPRLNQSRVTLTSFRVLNGETRVAVPDPFSWAVDAYHGWYLPNLDRWNAWITDEQRLAKRFVAGVLLNLMRASRDDTTRGGGTQEMVAGRPDGGVQQQMDAGQSRQAASRAPSAAERELRERLRNGEPERCLGNMAREDAEYRTWAEQSGSYVGQLINSPEFVASEASGFARGGPTAGWCWQVLALCSPRLCETNAGRVGLATMLQDSDRMVAVQMLGNEDSKALAQTHPLVLYPEVLLSYLAIAATATPAAFAVMFGPGDLRQALAENRLSARMSIALDRAGIARTAERVRFNSRFRDRLQALSQSGNRPLSESLRAALPFPQRSVAQYFVRREYWNLFRAAIIPLGSAYVVVVNAINSFVQILGNQSEGTTAFEARLGIVKALAKGGTSALEVWRGIRVLRAVGTVRNLPAGLAAGGGGLGPNAGLGVIGIVTGVLESLDAVTRFEDAQRHGRQDLAIGEGVRLAGGALSTLAGAITLVEAISLGSISFGPAGLIVTGLAAGLAIAGSLIITNHSHSPLQEFALWSFLGREADPTPGTAPTSLRGLVERRPTEDFDYLAQMKVLLRILNAFRARSRRDEGQIEVELPPYGDSETQLEVVVIRKYSYQLGSRSEIAASRFEIANLAPQQDIPYLVDPPPIPPDPNTPAGEYYSRLVADLAELESWRTSSFRCEMQFTFESQRTGSNDSLLGLGSCRVSRGRLMISTTPRQIRDARGNHPFRQWEQDHCATLLEHNAYFRYRFANRGPDVAWCWSPVPGKWMILPLQDSGTGPWVDSLTGDIAYRSGDQFVFFRQNGL